jgi:hypothetical protein
MCSFKACSHSIIFIPRSVKAWLHIYISQLPLIGTNSRAKQYFLIQGLKTRYMLCSRVITLCVVSNQTLIRYYLCPDVLKLDYVYSSQLNSMGTNRRAKQNVIHLLKARCMQCSTVKYSMCSFKTDFDSIIFISRRFNSRLYIQFTININRNESPHEKAFFIHYFITRYMLFSRVKYPMCSFRSNYVSVIFIPRSAKAR